MCVDRQLCGFWRFSTRSPLYIYNHIFTACPFIDKYLFRYLYQCASTDYALRVLFAERDQKVRTHLDKSYLSEKENGLLISSEIEYSICNSSWSIASRLLYQCAIVSTDYALRVLLADRDQKVRTNIDKSYLSEIENGLLISSESAFSIFKLKFN